MRKKKHLMTRFPGLYAGLCVFLKMNLKNMPDGTGRGKKLQIWLRIRSARFIDGDSHMKNIGTHRCLAVFHGSCIAGCNPAQENKRRIDIHLEILGFHKAGYPGIDGFTDLCNPDPVIAEQKAIKVCEKLSPGIQVGSQGLWYVIYHISKDSPIYKLKPLEAVNHGTGRNFKSCCCRFICRHQIDYGFCFGDFAFSMGRIVDYNICGRTGIMIFGVDDGLLFDREDFCSAALPNLYEVMLP